MSALIIAPSGAGKSVFLENAIYYAHNNNKQVDFFGVTHKGRNIEAGEVLKYAGLEQTDEMLEYSATAPEGEMVRKAHQLRVIVSRIFQGLHHGSSYPTIAIIDEVGNGHKALKRVHRIVSASWQSEKSTASRGEKIPRPELLDLPEEYKEAVGFSFTQGQSKNFRAWIISHDNTNTELGLDHALKLSSRYVGLCRDSQYAAFERVWGDNRFIPDKATRQQSQRTVHPV